jgi:hypothetical protein
MTARFFRISKHRAVLVISIVLLLLPFTGFPSPFKSFLVFLSGLILLVISVRISIKRRTASRNGYDGDPVVTSAEPKSVIAGKEDIEEDDKE